MADLHKTGISANLPLRPNSATSSGQFIHTLDQTNRPNSTNNNSPNMQSKIRWSSVDRNSSVTPSEGVQMQPVEIRYSTDPEGRIFSEHGHKMLVDGDAYTLVIVDCAPQANAIDSRRSVSSNCDCHQHCFCQTELIVRQQVVPHDHNCQHYCNRQSQKHLAIENLAIRSREGSTQRSESRQSESSQQRQQVNSNDHPKYNQQIDSYSYQERVVNNPEMEIQSEFSQGTQNYEQQDNSESRKQQHRYKTEMPQSSNHQQRVNYERVELNNQSLNNSNLENDHKKMSPTQSWHLDTNETITQHYALQQQSQQPQQREPRKVKPGNRLVKRWDWNQQQFIETEEPERIISKPQVAPKVVMASKIPTDVWNQDQNFPPGTSAESPTPVKHYDPSWLAYRVPDIESVQSDPLYQDLMFELQRLEEGMVPRVEEPIAPLEVFQKPAFGQRIFPESLEVKEYENVEFVCRVLPNSDPSLRVEWTINGKELLESSRYTNEFEFGVARLRIKRCEAEDSGVYQCKVSNSLGSVSSTATLRVHAKGSVQCETLHPAGLDKIRQLENPKQVDHVEEKPIQQAPKFLTHISDYVEKDEGDSVHFECCLSPVDDPDLKTEWFFNGRPLVTGSRFHTIDDFGFIVLDIDWLFPRDTGEYVCRATNSFGTDITRTVLRVRPDKNIVLDSQLENPNTTIDKLRQLEFPDVEQEIVVVEPDKPAHFVHHLRTRHNKQQYIEGDNVHFEARVGPATDGNLTVEWFHNDKPLISGHRFKPTFDFGHILLDILYVYPEDSGVYKCVARNATGTDVSQFEINVTGKPSLIYQTQLPKEMVGGVQKLEEMEAMWNRAPDPEEDEEPAKRCKPEFVLKPKPCVAFEGSCARFCCRIVGNPRPRLSWAVNGQTVVSGSRYKLTHDGMYHLIIPKCQLSDGGKIEVHAKNPLGECYASTELKVKRKLDDYRGVLKNSPNPWYDEQVLKTYRRQRSMDFTEDDEDFYTFYQQRLQQATEQQALSPLGNQLIGYMEPGTPDVNLLASTNSPLIEAGDLHPVVVEQQVVMAPAPSTIKRALDVKDTIKTPEKSFHIPADSSSRRQQQELDRTEINDDQTKWSNRQLSDGEENQQKTRVFGLNLPRQPAKTSRTEAFKSNQDSNQLKQQQQHYHHDDHAKHNQQEIVSSSTSSKQQERFDARLPPPSPESVVHGKEIHSQTHKQTQLERRANKEIVREIIEKEIFEQEHKGVTKDNVIRGSSVERGMTPTLEEYRKGQSGSRRVHFDQSSNDSMASWQNQQFNEEHQVLIEDYMTPPEFMQKIQPCQAIDGDEARFECIFIGDPTPTISWYRENKLIKPTNMYQIVTDINEMKSTLIIRRVTLNSDAVYTVKAENVAGSAKSSANLVVDPHPLPGQTRGGLARQMEGAIASTSGDTTSFTSGITTTSTSSSASVSTTADSRVFGLSTDQQTKLLDASNKDLSDSNQYKIVKSVRTRRLSPDEMNTLIRASPEGMIAPTFLHAIHDTTGKIGEIARLDARLLGSQPMEVRWLKDGQRVRPDKGHKLLLEGDQYTYLILEFSSQDEGFYECVASNRVGEAKCGAKLTASSGRLSVTGIQTPELTVTRELTRSPSPANQFGQANADPRKQHFGMTKHQFNPAMSQYTTTDAGLQRMDQIPKLIKRLESQQVLEGKSVTLRCQISSYPAAEVSWYKQNDKLIKPSKYFRIFKDNDETYCLKILETFPEDQGEYKCVARAPNGFVETTATITVIPNSPR